MAILTDKEKVKLQTLNQEITKSQETLRNLKRGATKAKTKPIYEALQLQINQIENDIKNLESERLPLTQKISAGIGFLAS